uniref:ER membrane protein complex subunit 6 n=1 Tax=Syphacia muris TaxID=451379 RepID=A0A0N5AGW5_9BILA
MPPTSQKRVGEQSGKDPSQTVISDLALRHNLAVLDYSRTCQAAATGMASGILGMTGIQGFICFSFKTEKAYMWASKANFEWKKYFISYELSITHSLISGLFTYTLFWNVMSCDSLSVKLVREISTLTSSFS